MPQPDGNHAVGESYFNLDGDVELCMSEDTDDNEPLSWRGDPEVTLSDWTLIVITKKYKPRAYHVHKRVLGNGPRSSKYFTKIFTNSRSEFQRKERRNAHHSNNSTKIELEQRDAKHIPAMLDFIYADSSVPSTNCGDTVSTAPSTVFSEPSLSMPSTSCLDDDVSVFLKQTITTHNAVSLRHLSRIFGCESLTLAVNKFIQRDLSFKTGPIYLKHAHSYKDTRLEQSAMRLCIDNFEEISAKALMQLPLHILKSLAMALKCTPGKDDNKSSILSEVVYLYLERNQASFTVGSLLDLTDSKVMPKIGPEPAIGFTALIRDLDEKQAIPHWKRLEDLCHRCGETVVCEYGWSDFSVESAVTEYLDGMTREKRSRIDSLLFATSFAAALQQAQVDFTENVKEQQRFEETILSLQQTISALEKSNKRKDEHIEIQKRMSEDSRKQIAYLKQQLHESRNRDEEDSLWSSISYQR